MSTPLSNNIPTPVKIVGSLVVVVAVVLAIVAITHGPSSSHSVSGAGTTTSEPTTIAEVPVAIVPTTTTLATTTLPLTTNVTLAPTTTKPSTTITSRPTTTSTAVAKLCGAPTNPYGYNFCGRGDPVITPATDTCTYFKCIDNFWNGKGYMVECRDAMYSMSGGRQGACSTHGGEEQTVYAGP